MALITGNSGTAKFMDANGSNFFTLAANGTTTADVNYTWPAADGASGTLLSTNASGVMSWAAAGGGLSSDSTSGSRSAGSGSGNVSYTGSSFTPTAIIVLAANDDNDDSVTVGFADSALDEGDLELTRMSGTPRFVTGGGTVIAISSNSGNDAQNASVASYNSDGVTLSWVKYGSGTQCTFRILYLK